MSGGIRNDPSASLHSSNPLHLNMKYPWVLGPGVFFYLQQSAQCLVPCPSCLILRRQLLGLVWSASNGIVRIEPTKQLYKHRRALHSSRQSNWTVSAYPIISRRNFIDFDTRHREANGGINSSLQAWCRAHPAWKIKIFTFVPGAWCLVPGAWQLNIIHLALGYQAQFQQLRAKYLALGSRQRGRFHSALSVCRRNKNAYVNGLSLCNDICASQYAGESFNSFKCMILNTYLYSSRYQSKKLKKKN